MKGETAAMKKIFAMVLALLMCFACAAEGADPIEPMAFETYAQSFAELTGEEWKSHIIEQIMTIKTEDGVTVSTCLSEGCIDCISVEFPCDQANDSVRAAIENLGWFSAEAIEQIFALTDDAQLEIEDCVVYRVHGENRDAFSICRMEDAENVVWQPIHGGEKLHTKIECSGMDVSRMITVEAAMLTNWEMCKRCDQPEDASETEQSAETAAEE